MPQKFSQEEIHHMVNACVNEAQGLNEWEQMFIADMDLKADHGRSFTEAQVEKLHQIYLTKVP